jgi:2,4-dienoyl-CoA reductase-like NADH-dependent reductase (Old Yellow Enzyme family)/thioredoxin reductase
MIKAPRTVVKNPAYKALFEPFKMGNLQLKNRVVMPPMWSKMGTAFGEVTDRMIDFYVERAKNGVGLIVIENTCVSWPAGKVSCNPIRLDDDKFIQGMHDLAEAVHSYGTKIATDLQHAGRQTTIGATEGSPIESCSAEPCLRCGVDLPHALTRDEIKVKVEEFAQAVRRTRDAGFDMAQLHGAHGYLITNFISPYQNKRTDEYGGSFENRMRFLGEIIARSRELVGPDFHIEVRYSADEGVEGGNTIDDGVRIARWLEEQGVNSLSVSVGTYESWPLVTPTMAAPRAPYAKYGKAIKAAVSIPVTLVGKLDDPADAVRMLEEGNCDLVAIGRQLIADAAWAAKVADDRYDDVIPCLHCGEGCLGSLLRGRRLSCDVNPAAGRESAWAVSRALVAKKVLVIGGGPAGLEAAKVAKQRGHDVTLYEKEKLGGLLNYAGVPAFKDDIRRYMKYAIDQVTKLGVDLKLGEEVTPSMVDTIKPDVIIVATGARPIQLSSLTEDAGRMTTVTDLLAGDMPPGDTVVVIGGGHVGCEVAWHLGLAGKKVTIVEMLPNIATDTIEVNRLEILDVFDKLGVAVRTNTTATAVGPLGVQVSTVDGRTQEIAADIVVSAVGFRADTGLYEHLKDKAPEVFAIGGCAGGQRIFHATHDGGEVARMI